MAHTQSCQLPRLTCGRRAAFGRGDDISLHASDFGARTAASRASSHAAAHRRSSLIRRRSAVAGARLLHARRAQLRQRVQLRRHVDRLRWQPGRGLFSTVDITSVVVASPSTRRHSPSGVRHRAATIHSAHLSAQRVQCRLQPVRARDEGQRQAVDLALVVVCRHQLGGPGPARAQVRRSLRRKAE